MANLTLSGLASGIDTDTLVAKLVAAQKTPITKVQGQQSVLQSKQSGINRLSDKLSALEATVVKLSSQAEIATPSASSSGSEVKATADGSAAQGSYDVRVAQLAKAERSYSTKFSDKDASGLFGAGTLRISVGGSDYDIAVTAADSLSSVASKISAATGEVQASVFSTGNGYRLQVAGTKTGTDSAITFSETGVSLGLSDPSAEVVSAQDAKVSVDGFTVTSHTNTLSNVASGLTLELKGTTSGAVYDSGTNSISGGAAASVSVSRDSASLKTSVSGFVTAYNDVVSNLNALNGTSPDPTLITVQQKLRTALRTAVSGLGGGIDSLAQVGVATNKDGTIRIDDKVFDKKLADDFSTVVGLFADAGTRKGVASAFKATITEMKKSGTGLLAVKQDTLSKQLLKMADRIDTLNAGLDVYEARLKRQFTAMEQALTKLNSQSSAVTSILNKA